MRQTKYKIRLVHLLLTDDSDPNRQQKSIKDLEKLQARGIEYVQVWNERWKDNPPRDNFARPQAFDAVPINKGHYGCFRAFADGALDHFKQDVDAFIMCEGDVRLMHDADTIIDYIDRAYEATQEHGIDYFSLGDKYTLEGRVLQSVPSEIHGDVEIVNKIIGIQMIMFPQRSREYLLDCFRNKPWDGADIFLNQCFMFRRKLGIFSQSPTGQYDGISALEGRERKFDNTKTKLVYLAPHMSTGGMPQFALTRIQAMLTNPDFEVHCIEYGFYSPDFVVQRNQVKDLLKDRFYSCAQDRPGQTKDQTLITLLEEIQPDIIHIEESPEAFDPGNRMSDQTRTWLYSNDRPWKIVETCHNIWFNSDKKEVTPDGMMLVTPYHEQNNFKGLDAYKEVVAYPIFDRVPTRAKKLEVRRELGLAADKIHVLNVGLWTSYKNQGELVEMARIIEELRPGEFHFHFVGNQAGNFKSYWGPIMEANLPDNVTVWGERHDTERFYLACDVFSFNSTWECSPLAIREAVSFGLTTFTRKLPQYLDTFTPYVTYFSDSASENAKILSETVINSDSLGDFQIPKDDFGRFTHQHTAYYGALLARQTSRTAQTDSNTPESFRYQQTADGFRLHTDALRPDSRYRAEFWDGHEVVYAPTDLQSGYWYKPSPEYHVPWKVTVYRDEVAIDEYSHTLTGQTVGISIDSSSLGDTLAWVGQVERFNRAHDIETLKVKTFKSWLFDRDYYLSQGIQLVDQLDGCDHTYSVGVYYSMETPWNKAKHKYDWRQQPLGKIASDRLGIDYLETRPKLAPEFLTARASSTDPHVVIATQSTAQAKYWNHPSGWQELTQWYRNQGITVYHGSKEGGAPRGSIQGPESLVKLAGLINSAEHFVGISSGLSWFAWALEQEVILISGFTGPRVEFEDKCTRIINQDVCHDCWLRHAFDKGDWNWCPDFKGTPRQFECTKLIEPKQVIQAAANLLNLPKAEPQKWSVIIPTIWQSKWTEELLNTLERSHLIDEIILIDNAVDKKPAHIDWNGYTKLRYLPQNENIYVNPAWNLGVSSAKNEMIAISNDDIVWQPEEVLVHMTSQWNVVGMGKNNIGQTKGKPSVQAGHAIGHGWGCLLMTRKSKWVPIPNEIKIWFGDDWIITKNRESHATLDYPGCIKGELSASADIPKFNPIKDRDKVLFKKYKYA